MHERYEQLSDSCRAAYKSAHRIARVHGQEVLDSNALLLGLTQAGEQTVAARILKDAGLWRGLCRRVEDLGVLPTGLCVPFVQGDDAKEALDAAFQRADELGHGYIGTEHLLLGMIGRCGLLTEEARNGGVSLERLRKDVYTLLGIDKNTAEDYRNHLEAVKTLILNSEDPTTTVKRIYTYLKGQMPNSA